MNVNETPLVKFSDAEAEALVVEIMTRPSAGWVAPSDITQFQSKEYSEFQSKEYSEFVDRLLAERQALNDFYGSLMAELEVFSWRSRFVHHLAFGR